jgi:hypothetical protein
MPRTFTFTPNDQDQIFAITVIRDELTVVNVSDGNTKLQLSISTTRGGSPIIQIPSTGGKFDLRPSLLESLDEGMTYQHNIWDYSNSVDGKRIATGTFTHAESIKSVDIAYPTVTLADGTLRIFVTQAQYDGIDPKLPNAEYVISDAATAPGEGNAPTAANALADQSYTQSTGDKTINAALDFQNAMGGAWSVSGAGATISTAGVVTIPTTSLRSAVTVTVTYTNASGVALSTFSVTVTAAAATSPVTAIDANGWRATYPSSPTFVPETAPVNIAVTRQGFNAAGQQVAVPENVVVMSRLREPYPSQATLTADKVILSDFVFSSDVIAGVANNSARPYPKPQAVWLAPDHQVFANTAQLQLFVDHTFARAGRPIAAVKFIASSGAASVELIVSSMVKVTSARSGLSVPVFQADLDISSLPDGPITVDAIIYPWVGAAFRLAANGHPAPHMTATTRACYKNANGTIQTVYAYVSTTGSDSTGVASPAAATAQASPFATTQAAANKIRDYNTANNGRTDVSGGCVRFLAGTYPFGGTAVAAPTVPFIMEAVSGAAVILTDGNINASRNVPERCEVRNVTLQKIGANTQIIEGSDALADSLHLKNCVVDQNGQSTVAYWISRSARIWMTDCEDITGLTTSYFSTQPKAISALGFKGKTGTAILNLLASKGSVWYANPVENGKLFSHAGAVCAFSLLTGTGTLLSGAGGFTPATDSLGLSIAGSIFERTDGGVGPAVRLWADGNTDSANNVNFTLNTNAGLGDPARVNALYNDTVHSPVSQKSWNFKFSVTSRFGTKTDVFAQDGSMIGNWPATFHLGHRGVTMLEGDTAGNGEIGPGSWRREVQMLGMQFGDGAGGILTPLWTDDRSFSGTGAGGGDYTPAAASPLQKIPAGLAPFPFDQRGRAILDNGNAVVGALQKA